MGTIKKRENSKLFIESPFLSELEIGQSVAHDGVCLTVTAIYDDSYEVELIPETFERTHFKNIQAGDKVNLERCMKADGRFDGHVVQGHCDFLTELLDVTKDGNASILKFAVPEAYKNHFVEKGSITINGISLTVIKVSDRHSGEGRNPGKGLGGKEGIDWFTVGIIPHTFEVTNLQFLKVGDLVNIETDILAKYFVKMFGKT